MNKQIQGRPGREARHDPGLGRRENRLVPVTVVQAGPCVVTQVRTADSDGYAAVQIALRRDRPAQGEQADGRALREGRRHAASPPGRAAHRRRRRVRPRPGDHRRRRSRPARRSTSSAPRKGKGFAGVMKRHGFNGVGASPRCAPQPPQARLHRRLRSTPGRSSRA